MFYDFLFNFDLKVYAVVAVIFIIVISILLDSSRNSINKDRYGNRAALDKIVYGAMLTSMAVVVKFSFQILPLPDVYKRLEIFVIFIILAGILLGPLYGGLVGFVTDLVYMFIFPGTFGLFTLSHILVGLLPGVLFLVLRYNLKTSILTVTVAVLTYFTINTIALNLYGITPANFLTVSLRLFRTLLVLPFQIGVVHLLVADRRFSSFSIYKRFYERQGMEV